MTSERHDPRTEGRAARFIALADREIAYFQLAKKLIARVCEVHAIRSLEHDGPRSYEFDEAICCEIGLVVDSCHAYLRKWDIRDSQRSPGAKE